MQRSINAWLIAIGFAFSAQAAVLAPAMTHWAFQPPVKRSPPEPRNPRWARTAIDRFVLAELERRSWRPSPEADKSTLIRRLSLDLTGLLPSPEESAAFLRDQDSGAYERAVDRLLDSPHFGERWGRHWLDLARYADSEGYQVDTERPYAYVYRNWVIQAFNNDLPYDQFTIEQIAGDLLPQATLAQKIAAGFHRNTLMNHEDGIDMEEFRCKAKVDRVSTTGTVWLGLTLGCAECHSHKYDPISQKEFYQLYAFFNNADEVDIPAEQTDEATAFAARKRDWEATTARIKTQIASAPVTETNQIALLKKQLEEHEKTPPSYAAAKAQSFAEKTNTPSAFVHRRGDFLRKGDKTVPGTLAVLQPFHARGQTADRLDLARWLVATNNPLAARVEVNRIWQHLFWRGLVTTPDDFGVRGERPSHPELLDWLACTFMERGWSRKQMIRLIVTSAVYRQSSRTRPDLQDADPENRFLARQNRFREDSEIIRDAYLLAGGLLNSKIGGKSFRPYLPDDIKAMGSAGAFSWTDDVGPVVYRRGMYIYSQRTVPYPVSITFDAPDAKVCCALRDRSDTPLQALTLLNHPIFVECAHGLAKRMMASPLLPLLGGEGRGEGEGSTRIERSASEQIIEGFRIALSRSPSAQELSRLRKLYDQELRETLLKLRSSGKSCDEKSACEKAEATALTAVAQVLLNLDEFVTRE